MTIRDLTATDNFFLLAGPCVIENEDMAMRIAERIVAMTSDRNIPYVFKGSYRKANRSRIDSFTGIGDEVALRVLRKVRETFNIPVVTDTVTQEVVLSDELEMIVLPGGMPGTINLENNPVVQQAIDYCMKNNKYIGAICAAPSILGHKGLLDGKDAVCFEGFESQLGNANILDAPVAVDGNIITARGAGVAIQFALRLAEAVTSKERSDVLKASILCE
jgi:4-methyl-5(b-hydroxyethyl)-thiazole monophosphate biosynthesis